MHNVRWGSISGALVSHSLQFAPDLESFNPIFLSLAFCGFFESQKSVLKLYQVRVVGLYSYFSIPCAEIQLLVLGNGGSKLSKSSQFYHFKQSFSALHPFCLVVLSQSSWVMAQLSTASRFIKCTFNMGGIVAVDESSQHREAKWQEDFC